MKYPFLLLLTIFFCFNSFAQNPFLLSEATGGSGSAKLEQIIATPSGNAFYNITDNANSFSYNWGLWTTNGTREGTQKLVLQDANFVTTEATLLTLLDSNRILFAGDNVQGYGEVWVSNGTPAGTFGLQNFSFNTSAIPLQAIGVIGSLGVYAATSNDGILRLHATHGNAYGDTAVFYTFPAAIVSVASFKTIKNILYFEANNNVTHDNEFWRTDGTSAGTYLLKDLTANGLTSDFMAFNSNVYFITVSSTLGDYIWKSDGTTAGTAPLKQLATTFQTDNLYPSYAATSSALYFAAGDGTHGKEVWATDGTAAGTHLVTDLFAGSTGSNPSSFVTLRDTLFLSASNSITGQELYTYNGSSIALVKDICPGGTGSNPASLAINNNSIVFSAKQNEIDGAELWVSGGSANTTFEMENITKPSGVSSSPSLITPGAKNFFTANYDINGDGITNEQCMFLYTPGKIWTGNVSTDASVADNWFPPGTPTFTDDVIIPASATLNSMTNPYLFPHSFYNNGGTVNANSGLVLMTGDFYNEGTINADINTSVFGIVFSTSGKPIHLVGSPGTYNGKLILSSGVKMKLTADLKVNDLRVEGNNDSIHLGYYNLTTDQFDLFIPKVITDGNGKLFLPVGANNVLFPVCADTLSYTPVTISNAGAYDYFWRKRSKRCFYRTSGE